MKVYQRSPRACSLSPLFITLIARDRMDMAIMYKQKEPRRLTK